MNRLTTDQLREIAVAAKHTEKAAKKKQAVELKRLEVEESQRKERQAQVWQSLYSAAINGANQTHIKNLYTEDVEYLEKLGFLVEKLFSRTQKQAAYAKVLKNLKIQVSRLDEKILDLEIKIDEYNYSIDGVYTSSIEDWLYSNQALAYACDLEPWFGPELNRVWINNLESLQSLKEAIESNIKISKNKERINSLKKLLKEINESKKTVDQSFNFEKAEDDVRVSGEKIQELEDEIADIEEDFGFIHSDDVHSLHNVDWSSLQTNSKSLTNMDYSVISLKWFCSTSGQLAFKLLQDDSLSLSKLGIRKINLRCIDYGGPVYMINDNGVFNCKFPSTFDFLEAMRLIGYRVSGLKNSQIGATYVVTW